MTEDTDPSGKGRGPHWTAGAKVLIVVVGLGLALGIAVDTFVAPSFGIGLEKAAEPDATGPAPPPRPAPPPPPADGIQSRLAAELAGLKAELAGEPRNLRGSAVALASVRAPPPPGGALPRDRCLPHEGDLCREACNDLHWLGRYNKATQLTESCFRVKDLPWNKAKALRAHVQPAGEVSDPNGLTAGEACCALGGGETIAIRESPRLLSNEVDVSFLPEQCHGYVPRQFPSIHELTEAGKGDHVGRQGGKWTPCTHLKIYGLNFAAFHARHIAYGLRPRSVLEFGCGLGTTSDYLARHIPGGSHVVCVEPEVMLGEVFAHPSRAPPQRPVQIAMNSFEPASAPCVDALFKQKKYELVLTLEVAEHLDPSQLEPLADLLAAATGKYLVFSAARPRQRGTGHVEGSMKPCAWWRERFEERGLRYLHGLTERLRFSAKPEREYDIGTHWNMIVMGAPGVADLTELPEVLGDCDLYPHKWCKHPSKDAREQRIKSRADWLNGQAMALWPELHVIWRQIKQGRLRCG